MRRTKITREGAVLLIARGAGSDLVGAVERVGTTWVAVAFDRDGREFPGIAVIATTRANAASRMLGLRDALQAASDAVASANTD